LEHARAYLSGVRLRLEGAKGDKPELEPKSVAVVSKSSEEVYRFRIYDSAGALVADKNERDVKLDNIEELTKLKNDLKRLWDSEVRAPGIVHKALVSVCYLLGYEPRALSTGRDELPTIQEASKDEWARVRNVYTANFLRAHLESDPRSFCGLVILVGDFHIRADQCGAPRTLQACVGVGENRTFHAPFWASGQGWEGQNWKAWLEAD
jgi:hypothetical protein